MQLPLSNNYFRCKDIQNLQICKLAKRRRHKLSQYELNNSVTMTIYLIPDLSNEKRFSWPLLTFNFNLIFLYDASLIFLTKDTS